MDRRSKYIIALIVVMQPLTQIIHLMYVPISTDPVTNDTNCHFNLGYKRRIVYSLQMCLAIAIPFLVIATFNLATITVLCRNRCRQHTVSGNRDHVLVFTKITIMTGVSFVISYFPEVYRSIFIIFDLEMDSVILIAMYLSDGMVYLNSCMNPIICLVVCRSMHEDMKSFLMALIRILRRPCACRQSRQDSQTANASQIATPV